MGGSATGIAYCTMLRDLFAHVSLIFIVRKISLLFCRLQLIARHILCMEFADEYSKLHDADLKNKDLMLQCGAFDQSEHASSRAGYGLQHLDLPFPGTNSMWMGGQCDGLNMVKVCCPVMEMQFSSMQSNSRKCSARPK